MTDRELLEAAARAAGIKAVRDPDGVWRNCTGLAPAFNIFAATAWNPLADDGDALRLAVALKMNVNVYKHGAEADCDSLDSTCKEAGEPFAATRRAIVRAAAAMGAA